MISADAIGGKLAKQILCVSFFVICFDADIAGADAVVVVFVCVYVFHTDVLSNYLEKIHLNWRRSGFYYKSIAVLGIYFRWGLLVCGNNGSVTGECAYLKSKF